MTNRDLKQVRFSGARLRALRGARTLEEVANALGITPQSLQQMEKERNRPAADTLGRMCLYFGANLSDFYDTPPKKIGPSLR